MTWRCGKRGITWNGKGSNMIGEVFANFSQHLMRHENTWIKHGDQNTSETELQLCGNPQLINIG